MSTTQRSSTPPHNVPPCVPKGMRPRLAALRAAEDGMGTVEYAIGTLAAAAFAAVLYSVVTGDSVVSALTALIERALSAGF
ncbi:Protein of unknown function [Haloechinothrix alba]|uniref:DUF4244 domain-containing protein n=1 Tax=Haloechinothrix alba TaxID=664784 RepID=A0A238XUE6_9PSEU|nr:Protein of unknown function [Haloechinothrix alba]